MFVPLSSSLRFTVPKIELLARDRRSGAYPTKARTGDRTRTGKNRFYFDDTRTVMFVTGTAISLPTTLRSGSRHLASDMMSNFIVNGNVKEHAADEWIAHRDLSEVPGPFVEDKLFEQDEHAVLNSSFMTGAAHAIAPDKFKMGVSSKTAVRITIPITQNMTLNPTTSSLYYFNPTSGTFELIANERYSENNQAITPFNFLTSLTMFDPILFTPFGYLNVPVEFAPTAQDSNRFRSPSQALFAINDFVPDGDSTLDYYYKFLANGKMATGSLINSRHRASTTQSINLTNCIPGPFLLEKAVVEFPFAAGPGWMNDAYVMEPFVDQLNATQVRRKKVDAGGPMITVALLRQDSTTPFHRDLITSATFTNAFDALTASYKLSQISVDDSAGNGVVATQQIYARTGVSGTIDPTFIVRGPVMSGSTNFFTGTVRLPMTPAVTHHITRQRLSGTNRSGFYLDPQTNVNSQAERRDHAYLMTIGAPTRRPGVFGSGRSVLGNNIATLPLNGIDGTDVPVKAYESDHESLTAWTGHGGFERGKVYWDLISSTRESPYLLYPGDNLVLCLNKHRSTANSASFGQPTYAQVPSFRPATLTMRAQHDAQIITGSMTITLYGDLLKEDHEFHDTLNQRLETLELWETIGEEPVLDQFDVTYTTELSASYLDRNNIFHQVPYIIESAVVASTIINPVFQFVKDVGHFCAQSSNVEQTSWNGLANTDTNVTWPYGKFAYELRKNNRNPVLTAIDEIFWDTRIPNPSAVASVCNPQYVLANDAVTCLQINSLVSGDVSDLHAGSSVGKSTGGIRDWFMSYPYENRYSNIEYTFFFSLNKNLFRHPGLTAHGNFLKYELLNYNNLSIELGDLTGSHSSCSRFLASENIVASTNWGTGYVPLKKPEFVKFFYGIGNGIGTYDNQHVRQRLGGPYGSTADIRGWRHGMMNAFPMYNTAIFRRSHYGQFRDMLEQRLDAKFVIENTVGESPVKVVFYDREGNLTDSTLTLSSNLSIEATSSFPYADGIARNRGSIDYSNLNISSVVM